MAQPLLSHHADLTRVAGDDWVITCTVVDETNTPLDLSGADDVQWALLGADGLPAIPELSATVTVADVPPGTVTVTLPHDITAMLNPGRYPDALRIILAGKRTVVSEGLIMVGANPFLTIDMPHPLPLPA
jgi:hypothetical protein